MNWKCEKCNQSFTRKSSLNRHNDRNCNKMVTIERTQTISEKITITTSNCDLSEQPKKIPIRKKQEIIDPEIMTDREMLIHVVKEINELKNKPTHVQNNTLNINIIFQSKGSKGDDNAIDIFECLKEKGWSIIKIYQHALYLVGQPKDKLRWMLNKLIIDMTKMKFPLDYKDKKFWMQISPEGDMVETNSRTIDRINNQILKDFAAKAHNAVIEEQIALSEHASEELENDNDNDHYSTDEEENNDMSKNKSKTKVIKIYQKEKEEKINQKRKKKVEEKKKKEQERDDKLLAHASLNDPENQNIMDKALKLGKIELKDKYIKEIISEANCQRF